MNDLILVALPFVLAIVLFAVWLVQLRQSEASARAARARRLQAEAPVAAPTAEPVAVDGLTATA